MEDSVAVTVGALALPLFAAHLLADHAFQPSSWAAAKGAESSSGRVACAKHTVVVVAFQASAVLATVVLTGLSVHPGALAVGLAFTAWSHYWFDRRFTAAGLYAALGKAQFAALGAPRSGHDDNPCLGSGAYRMDQDWHTMWLALSALVFAAEPGAGLGALGGGCTAVMVASVAASRVARHHALARERVETR